MLASVPTGGDAARLVDEVVPLQSEEIVIPAAGVRSLRWDGETLVDDADGGARFDLDGTAHGRRIAEYFRFDRALVSPTGRFTVLLERYGTKAVLFEQGRVRREIDRSFYLANAYEYPLTFLLLPDGREAIAHCPREYCRIDIEVAATGQRLTDRADRKPLDIFHSRLALSPGGKWLGSAGWYWHPFDIAKVWSIEDVLADPRVLDQDGVRLGIDHEVESMLFLDDTRLLLACGADNLDDVPTTPSLRLLELPSARSLAQVARPMPNGTLVPCDREHVLALYEHPRLVRLADGVVLREWPHLPTGRQRSSIGWLRGTRTLEAIPPFAKHPHAPMFAVAAADRITVVRLR